MLVTFGVHINGAALDLMILKHGRTIGFEIKCYPKLTTTMKIAVTDLGLDH